MKVMIRIPTRGQPSHFTVNRMNELEKKYPDVEWDIEYHCCPYSVAIGRNEIIEVARQKDVDYLIMMDDDIIPTSSMMEMPYKDRPVLAGLVPVWQAGYFFWNAFTVEYPMFSSVNPTHQEIQEVYAAGTGILCIRKDVLHNDSMYPFFTFRCSEKGVMVSMGGEDIWFSTQCQKNGIPVAIDPTVQGEHYRAIALKQTMQAISDNLGNPEYTVPTPFSIDIRGLPFDLPNVKKPENGKIDQRLERLSKTLTI